MSALELIRGAIGFILIYVTSRKTILNTIKIGTRSMFHGSSLSIQIKAFFILVAVICAYLILAFGLAWLSMKFWLATIILAISIFKLKGLEMYK